MNGKTKTFTVILAAIAICMLLYSPLTQATENKVSFGDDLTMAEIEQIKLDNFLIRPRARFVLWFLKNAEPVEVEGKVVVLSERKLVLNIEENQIRVNMPNQWTVNNQVISLNELYENYLIDQSVTIKVLEAEMVNKEGLRIYIHLGYKLTTESGIQANACLKINVDD
ncbi:MAG: hypothetical protein P8X91_00255 [Candidatus Bathyarchaeota archaeon]|jgi:hypothetical protein